MSDDSLSDCVHARTVVLYAQRRTDGKRGFRPEGRKCEDCGEPLGLEGAIEYRVPRVDEHRAWKCRLDWHWLSYVTHEATGALVGVRCGACHKDIRVHGAEGGA